MLTAIDYIRVDLEEMALTDQIYKKKSLTSQTKKEKVSSCSKLHSLTAFFQTILFC